MTSEAKGNHVSFDSQRNVPIMRLAYQMIDYLSLLLQEDGDSFSSAYCSNIEIFSKQTTLVPSDAPSDSSLWTA